MEVPQSYIKNIAIRIRDDFEFENTPLTSKCKETEEDFDSSFIGRKQQLSKFKEFLYSKTKRGVFLVTGYRGMGKTSFVNKAIWHYKNYKNAGEAKKNENKREEAEKKNIIALHLTLAQNNLSEFDILRMIAIGVFHKYKEIKEIEINREKERSFKLNFPFYLSYILIPFLFLYFIVFQPGVVSDFLKNSCGFKTAVDEGINILKWFGYGIFFVGGFTLILLIDGYRINLKKATESSRLKRIRWLVERCHSTVSEEQNDSKEITISGIKTVFGFSPKRTKAYAIASAKEIEYELKVFLEDVSEKDKLEFLFIFDELDKIESSLGFQYIHEDLETYEASGKDNDYFTQLRNRKEAVINVIASLKNFLTSAEARFVFIAGREIFDASLADIADKQSSVNSIFTYIFNIESLLKDDGLDNTKSSPSLSTSIEDYLKKTIFEDDKAESFFKRLDETYNPNHIKQNNSNLTHEEYYKLYFILQSFVTYLVYRSNGSPKKLKKAIQDFIIIIDDNENAFHIAHEAGKLFLASKKEVTKPGKYIYFNYLNQYRIGFINYLYRPFLLQRGRTFKMYSDNTNIAIPYLFDHLLKFHPFAFSFSNLELVPEILSASKTPYLKQHMGEIVNYLKANHLRETDVELFDYKFYSRTQNEIIFISKIFEEEAAAFNFTLDESYPVKMLVNNKIKELRSIYARFHNSSDLKNQQIFSIAYLNGNLGDLHFFDQEFDSAIGCYSDAIRPINNLEIESMNLRDFTTLTRNKLKIGLCFEKINSYEEALAFYSDASQDAKRFISYRLNNSISIDEESPVRYIKGNRVISNENKVYLSSSLNDLLQIVIQCFLAKITIQEKMGLEGITSPKIGVSMGGFLTLAHKVGEKCGQNHLINANAFLHLGNTLYFKNSSVRTNNYTEIKGFFPEKIKSKIDKLENTRDIFLKNLQNINKQNKREPILAYQMYLIGLDEVMKSRPSFINISIKKEEENGTITNYTPIETDIISNFDDYNVLSVYLDSLAEYININDAGVGRNDENLVAPHLRYIATFLSSIGDCIMGMHGIEDPVKKIDKNNYRNLRVTDLFDIPAYDDNRLEIDEDLVKSESFFKKIKPTNLHHFTLMDVIKCYYISGLFFKKYGRSASCGFQFKKILHVLRVVLGSDNTTENRGTCFIHFLQKNILNPIIEIAGQNIGNTNIHVTNKARKITATDKNNSVENFVSNHLDTKEAILIFTCIKMKLNENSTNSFETIRPEIDKLITPYNVYSTQYSRILELDLYCKYIETYPKNLGLSKVIDCLFSLLSILRLLAVDGQDFMMSPSYIAYIHFRIAKFIKKNIVEDKYDENKLQLSVVKEKIETLLGDGAYSALDKYYHYAMARDNYERAIQLHTAGKEYKKTINDMIYLEDDFNDNAYHFGAAIDRYLMVNGVFTEHIDICNKALAANV